MMEKTNINPERAHLQMLDVVALVKEIPDKDLLKGQVGTIVELLEPGIYEVEFTTKQGETKLTLALPDEFLMRLHFETSADV